MALTIEKLCAQERKISGKEQFIGDLRMNPER